MSDAQHERGPGGRARARRTAAADERRRRLLAVGGARRGLRDRRLPAGAAGAAADARPGRRRWPSQVESGAIDAAGTIVPRERRAAGAALRRRHRHPAGRARRAGASRRSTATARTSRSRTAARTSNVVHKPQARWLIDAGPYPITVHGTVFTASWDESQQRLDVKMERGLVSVTGPVTNGPIAVRAGQALTVKLKRSQVLLRDLDRDDVVGGRGCGDDGDADADLARRGPRADVTAPRAGADARRRGGAEDRAPARRQELDGRAVGRRLRHHPRGGGARHRTRARVARHRGSGRAGRRRPLPPSRRRRAPGVARAAPPVRGLAARRGRRVLPRPSRRERRPRTRRRRSPGTNAIWTKRRAARTWPRRWAAR